MYEFEDIEPGALYNGGDARDWYRANEESLKQVDALEERIARLKSELKEWKAIAKAHESALDRIGETHMELPLDADGVPVRVGDILAYDGGELEVMAVSEGCVWFDTDPHEVRLTCEDAGLARHVDFAFEEVERLLEGFWRETDGIVFPGDKDGLLWRKKAEYARIIRKAVER